MQNHEVFHRLTFRSLKLFVWTNQRSKHACFDLEGKLYTYILLIMKLD